MLTSVIALLLLLMAVCGISSLLCQRSEQCIPLCFSGIILWLYGFYCVNIVKPGLLLLCAAIVCIFLLAVKRKTFRNVIHSSLTPGLVLYLALSVLYIVLLSGNKVALHDELRLWSAVPKAIHETGLRQLGQAVHAFSTVQSYPPALPLADFFFTAFTPDFSEGALYVGYACFALAFFIPVFSDWNWKHSSLLAPAGVILLLAPCFFTSHIGDSGMYGVTLFVDPLLGIISGYAFACAGRKPFRDWISTASFGMTLAVLALCKDTGLLFAGAALLAAVLLDGKKFRSLWLLPAAIMLLPWGVWKLLLAVFDVHALVPLRFHALSGDVVGNVLRALVTEKMMVRLLPVNFLFSFVVVYGALWLCYSLAFRFTPNRSAKRSWVLAVFMFASFVGFVYGYTLIYGEGLQSFQRYMTTPLLCLFMVVLYEIMPASFNDRFFSRLRLSRKIKAVFSVCCVLFGTVIFAIWVAVYPGFALSAEADADAAQIRTAVNQALQEGEKAQIFLVMSGDKWENSNVHHRIFFDLISDRMMIRNGLAETEIADPTIDNPAQVWAEQLRNRCNFVYLQSIDDGIISVCQTLAPDLPCNVGLYRVVPADTSYGITLQPA